jgi:hypothetical protein
MTRGQIIWIGGPLVFGLPVTLTGFLERWERYHDGGWSNAPLLYAFELSTSLLLGYLAGALFAWLVLGAIERLRG